MAWLQLRIVAPRDNVPKIEKALSHGGALSITLEDNADQPIFEPELGETPLWFETQITGLFPADIDSRKVLELVSFHAKIDPTQAHWHVLEEKDWEREWMRHYQPIKCGDNFWICPSWLDAPDPNATNLILDPGLAFGTGTHPTTFLCLKWLAKQQLESLSVLDYGCGSGILGIASLLLGAQAATGVDIDPQALLASQDNAQRNKLAREAFPVYFPSKRPNQPCDVVLANILAGPLVELADELLSLLKPSGKLCLSGILASQKDAVMKAYAHQIEFDKAEEKDGWACLTGRKS